MQDQEHFVTRDPDHIPFSVHHDLHIHSCLSDCCNDPWMTADNIHAYAKKAGYTGLCLTDHMWDASVPGAEPWYVKQPYEHIRQALPLPEGEPIFYFGCETEYCGGEKIGITRQVWDQLDFIVVPLNHFHKIGFVRPEGCDTAEKIAALFIERLEQLLELDLPWQKIGIPHLTTDLTFSKGDWRQVYDLLDQDRFYQAFAKLAERGAAIELNAHSFPDLDENPEQLLSIYRTARKAGCKFYCSSDAHKREHLLNATQILRVVADKLGLTEDDRYRLTAPPLHRR